MKLNKILGALALSLPIFAYSQSFVPGQLLAIPKAGVTEVQLQKEFSSHSASVNKKILGPNVLILQVPAGNEKALVAKLKNSKLFKSVELDEIHSVTLTPNDPQYPSQWHIPAVSANLAWDTPLSGSIKITICDTGVNNVADLSVLPGFNFYNNTTDVTDSYGHGTPVAGTAAAIMNNGIGVAGISGTSQIIPVKIADPQGYGTFSAMTSCIRYGADNGSRIANISFSGAAGSSSVWAAADYMRSLTGGLTFISASNTGNDPLYAASDSIISVSALTTTNTTLASWSSFGNYVDITAPGVNVLTTGNDGSYRYANGTSFSSPLTAGVGALVMSVNPLLSANQVQQILFDTANDLGTLGKDPYFGWGRVNAYAAVQKALITDASDVTAPTVTMSGVTNNGVLKGVVGITVTANDSQSGVGSTGLLLDSSTVLTDNVAPYLYSLDTTGYSNGIHVLQATALDRAGNTGNSAAYTVAISNNDTTPPTVSITSPQQGAVISGKKPIRIATYATDDSSKLVITQELSVNGVLVAKTVGTDVLSTSWKPARGVTGLQTISVKAYDAYNNVSTTSITVTVR